MLPGFLIIGVQRCGTSSLYDYLVQHPRIVGARRKEVRYFNRYYSRGLNWYRSFFPAKISAPAGSMTGEATPEYIFNPHVIERVKSLLPDVRLIVMLRNPSDRAYSHYHLSTRYGYETLDFRSALEAEEDRIEAESDKLSKNPFYRSRSLAQYSYKFRGLYLNQLKPWIESFGRDRVHIIQSEEFYSDPETVYGRTLEFLNQDRWKLKLYKNRNPAKYDRIDPETRSVLVSYFEPHNKKLYEYLDTDFGWK